MVSQTDLTKPKKAVKQKPNWPAIEALYLAKVPIVDIRKHHPNVSARQITARCAARGLHVARENIQGSVSRIVEKSVLSIAEEVGGHIAATTRNLAKELNRRSKKLRKVDDEGLKCLIESTKSLTMIRSAANPGDPSQDKSSSNQPIQINIGSMPIRRSEPRKLQGEVKTIEV